MNDHDDEIEEILYIGEDMALGDDGGCIPVPLLWEMDDDYAGRGSWAVRRARR